MSIDIQTREHRNRLILFILTVVLAGRAMTLAYIGQAGGAGATDPPLVWLLPLVGDAIIGLSALGVAALLLRRSGTLAWTLVIVWNALAIWDALSAYVIHRTVPWPSFFMIEIFGGSMFFLASAMHAVCIAIAVQPATRRSFGVA